MTARHPRSTLFPYTTLFRSDAKEREVAAYALFRLGCASAEAVLRKWFADREFREPLPQHCFSTGEARSEEHTSELQSQSNLVCRLLLEKKKQQNEAVHKAA